MLNEDITYKNIPPTELLPPGGVYENCTFINCDFSYTELFKLTFIDCVMDSCNLSMLKLAQCSLQNVHFKDCKISGVDFSQCSSFAFSVNFTNCLLNYCVFFKMKMKATKFIDCKLGEADFSEADLSNSAFKNCDLSRTVFARSVLKSADLSTAYNFNIDPEINVLTKAKFSADGLAGLLVKHNIVIS